MNHNKPIQRSRLPKGIASKNPVPMRLSTDEKEDLNIIAARESRSLSSMARIIYLEGLKKFR